MAIGVRGARQNLELEKGNSQASLESGSPRAATFKMGVVDPDDASSQQKKEKKDKDKKKKKKKDKDKKRDKSEGNMRRGESAPQLTEELEDIK